MSQSFKKRVGENIADRYSVMDELGRGGMGVVYRVMPFDDPSQEVAIKVIQHNGKMNYGELLRFQKEAALMSQLHHQNIISFHELGLIDKSEADDEAASGYYIVMEYAKGQNLKDSLRQDGRKDLAYFLQIGLQVAEALDYTHGKNIIHRDIKPHNIIVTQASKDERGVMVKILDFGVARLAEAVQTNRDGQISNAHDDQAGTPLYMSPEQSTPSLGPSDHRVDLYALGCVLYEVLTGHPPFNGPTREALERAHRATEEEPLTTLRPDIPQVVAMIVHKLLAKRPEDRYQTAFSLQSDLLRAKSLSEQKQRRTPVFPLGLKDRFLAVSAQLPLAGCEEEMKFLRNEYEQIASAGRCRLAVIAGGAGLGKTRLMSEFKTELSQKGVRFIHGVFSKHENTLPFNALANAFNELLMRTLKMGGADAEELSRRVRTIVGPDAHLVATVVPGLKPFVGDLPSQDIPSSVTPETFNRFAKAFSDFTRCLASDNQPLVFLFDDLHWADERTLDLIYQFFSNANSLKFLLVFTYQSDAAVLSKRFQKFLEDFRPLKRRFSELSLKPLGRKEAETLVASMLRAQDVVPEDFMDQLMERSLGIPMRLVELTRRMVAQDVIRLQGRNLGWEFDTTVLKATPVRLHAIDLVLSKLSEYKDADLEILQAGAAAGMVFQYEMLMLSRKHSAARVMRLLERAMEDGMVVRCDEDDDLKHLGKAYMFTHRTVRDAVYDLMSETQMREAHYQMANCLIQSLNNPKGIQLFALAHHLNKSVDPTQPNQEVDALRLKYALTAGDEAASNESWLPAKNYYDMGLRILGQWPDKFDQIETRIRFIERLAMVNGSLRFFGAAQKYYQDILAIPMPREKRSMFAARSVGVQMVSGFIGSSVKMVISALRNVGRAIPNATPVNVLKAFFWLGVDGVTGFGQTRMMRGLKQSFQYHRKYGAKTDELFVVARLYQLCMVLFGRDDDTRSLVAHDLAVKEVVHGRAPLVTAIKVVADRASYLAAIGFVKMPYRLFDMCAEVARGTRMKRAWGYTLLKRATSVDYIKGRHEEVSDNLRKAQDLLSPDEDRLAFAELLVFQQYRELVRCRFKEAIRLGLMITNTVPTRNWNTPVAFALMMYGHLVRGSRSSIAADGAKFLERREEVSARMDSIFSQAVVAMVAFARGETDKARDAFERLVAQWVGKKRGEVLQPWQKDFLGLFVCTYPMLFEQEYGRALMRTEEMHSLMTTLRNRGRFATRQRRAIQHLLWARTNELLGRAGVRANYDAALRSAKESNNNLVQTLSYMWLGLHRLDAGEADSGDYLRRSYRYARKDGLEGVAAWIAKSALRRKYRLDVSEKSQVQKIAEDISIGLTMPAIAKEHLKYLASHIDRSADGGELIAGSMEILGHYHGGRNFIFLAHIEDHFGCIFPTQLPKDIGKMQDAVSLYFNLRSTLSMHSFHAPWLAGNHDVASSQHRLTLVSDNGTEAPTVNREAGFSAEATQVLGEAPQLSERTQSPQSAGTAGSSAEMSVGGADPGGMFAMVPLRVGGENIGVLLIEELVQQGGDELHILRRALDLFGCQLSMLIAKRYQLANTLSKVLPNPKYDFGSLELTHAAQLMEPCPWLAMTFSGKMREGREASWYLGLKWNDLQYLVVYCCLRGDAADRDQLSQELYRHVRVARETVSMTGRGTYELTDLRDEFGGMFTRASAASRMDEVLFAFSLFDKDSGKVSSGHLGGARPAVIGSDNNVTAFNQVPVQLRDGRDVRYWEVEAIMGSDAFYLLSYDTSKVSERMKEATVTRGGKASLAMSSTKNIRAAIESVVARTDLPRYYLAITRRVEVSDKTPPIDKLPEPA